MYLYYLAHINSYTCKITYIRDYLKECNSGHDSFFSNLNMCTFYFGMG